MNKSLISILITATLGLSQSYAMTALNDEELSEVEGQSLMNLEFQQGTNTTDAQGKTYNQSNIGFYKLALSAELELNANIKKLQLGCGGDNNSIRNTVAVNSNVHHATKKALCSTCTLLKKSRLSKGGFFRVSVIRD